MIFGDNQFMSKYTFTYKILQYISLKLAYNNNSYVKWAWDMSQYNKVSDFQYGRCSDIGSTPPFWWAGIPTVLCLFNRQVGTPLRGGNDSVIIAQCVNDSTTLMHMFIIKLHSAYYITCYLNFYYNVCVFLNCNKSTNKPLFLICDSFIYNSGKNDHFKACV